MPFTYLNRTQRVQNVRIVAFARRHSTRFRTLAPPDELEYLVLVQFVQVAHQIQGRDAPIHAGHSGELRHAIHLRSKKNNIYLSFNYAKILRVIGSDWGMAICLLHWH